MDVWLDQGGCIILQHGNMLLGFCQREETDREGVITFVYPNRECVERMHKLLGTRAKDQPKLNPVYRIYHFFTTDPDGRTLEFQSFEHPLSPHFTLTEGLITRRSIRSYLPDPVPKRILNDVFELCRYSPTARNLQGYYYIVIEDKELLQRIVEIRGPAGAPILAAPLAIAVGASGDVSRRVIQDACIAAYHLLLAAKAHGLGTCWVTDMDNLEVKKILGVPEEDYIACLTPLGYPSEEIAIPRRHEQNSFVRYL
jgi:nitroreductase